MPIYPATCRKIDCNKVLSIKHLHIGTIFRATRHTMSRSRVSFVHGLHQPTVFTWITPNPRCFSGLQSTSDYPRQGSFLMFNVLFSYHWSRRQSTKLALLYDIAWGCKAPYRPLCATSCWIVLRHYQSPSELPASQRLLNITLPSVAVYHVLLPVRIGVL